MKNTSSSTNFKFLQYLNRDSEAQWTLIKQTRDIYRAHTQYQTASALSFLVQIALRYDFADRYSDASEFAQAFYRKHRKAIEE